MFQLFNTNRIFIPFQKGAAIGGPTTFMANLKRYLDESGFKYASGPRFAKGIFFPIDYDLEVIRRIKHRGGKVIQRLDGIYYPSKHGDAYIKKNGVIKDIYLNYADVIVFQSEYSRKQCFAMFGEKKADEYALILNGVNKNIFYPDKSGKTASDKMIFATTGNFRNRDMVEPLVLALDSLAGRFGFELWLIGPVNNPGLEGYLDRGYIRKFGPLAMEEVAGLLRKSDIFLYSHLNPPCPNSVLEAVSCGLPVVGFDSGAMSELLFFQKELLAYVSDDIFQKYEDFDWRKLAAKIELAAAGFKKYKTAAMANSHQYPFSECGKQYADVFNKVLAG